MDNGFLGSVRGEENLDWDGYRGFKKTSKSEFLGHVAHWKIWVMSIKNNTIAIMSSDAQMLFNCSVNCFMLPPPFRF